MKGSTPLLILSLYPDGQHVFEIADTLDTLFQDVSDLFVPKRQFERFRTNGGYPTDLPQSIPYTSIPQHVLIHDDQREAEATFVDDGVTVHHHEQAQDDEEEEEEEEEEIVQETGKRSRDGSSTCAKSFERGDLIRFMQFLQDNQDVLEDALFPASK